MKPTPHKNAEFIIAKAMGYEVTLDYDRGSYTWSLVDHPMGLTVEEPEWQEVREQIKWLWGEGDGPDNQLNIELKRVEIYKSLVKTLAGELSYYRERKKQYDESIATLQSERDANSMLTKEIERLKNEGDRHDECEF